MRSDLFGDCAFLARALACFRCARPAGADTGRRRSTRVAARAGLRLLSGANLLWLALHGNALHAADPAPARYSLKAELPEPGSFIRRANVKGSSVPFEKSYDQLTAEQQAMVKSVYEQLGPDDEPPYPLKGVAPIYKAIARGQDRILARGDLTIVVDVDAQGDATSVSVLRAPDDEQMVHFAARVLMLQKYKPGRCAGVPCSMQFPLRMTFDTRP